jgi:hypothetical protein
MSSPLGLEDVGIVAMTVLLDWRRAPSLEEVGLGGAGVEAEAGLSEGLYQGRKASNEKRGSRIFRYMLRGRRALLEWVM